MALVTTTPCGDRAIVVESDEENNKYTENNIMIPGSFNDGDIDT